MAVHGLTLSDAGRRDWYAVVESNGSLMQAQCLQDPEWGLGLIEDVEMEAGNAGVKELLTLADRILYSHI